MSQKVRCSWAASGYKLMQLYHDKEWGVPVRNDRKHFEFIVLDGAQAGLSWQTIINKRAGYRRAFDNFDVEKVACYSKRKVEKLLGNPEIVRNRLKVESAVSNAQAFIEVQHEFGSFNKFIWQFVGGETIQNRYKSLKQIPAETKESRAMSKELKRRGFRFVGPTICYAYMQAAGMVNDHTLSCFRYQQLAG